jgi:hypothetical protein
MMVHTAIRQRINLEMASYRMRLEFEIDGIQDPLLLANTTRHASFFHRTPACFRPYRLLCFPLLRALSLVVGATLGGLAGGHGHVLNNDSVTLLRSSSNPCSVSAGTTGDFKVVVDVSGGSLPGLAAVGADFKLDSTKTSVHDGGSKPVLGFPKLVTRGVWSGAKRHTFEEPPCILI